MMQYFSAPRAELAQAFPQLTDGKREIPQELSAQKTNAEIARTMGVTPKTVRDHLSNIFVKLQVASRAEAIARARDV